MRSLRLGAIGLLLGLAACDSPLLPWVDGDVEVRIANLSSFAFERVDVVFPEDEVSYGAIPANGLSTYRGVEKAYRYAYIEVQMAGEELRIQPIDYVGENLLGSGKYTYALNVTVEGQLTLLFQKD
jgi:hypothetical protein